jgi:hypothetical protein
MDFPSLEEGFSLEEDSTIADFITDEREQLYSQWLDNGDPTIASFLDLDFIFAKDDPRLLPLLRPTDEDLLLYCLVYHTSSITKSLAATMGVGMVRLGLIVGYHAILITRLVLTTPELPLQLCSHPLYINLLAIQLFNLDQIDLMIELLRATFRTEKDLMMITSSVSEIGRVDPRLIVVERALSLK